MEKHIGKSNSLNVISGVLWHITVNQSDDNLDGQPMCEIPADFMSDCGTEELGFNCIIFSVCVERLTERSAHQKRD